MFDFTGFGESLLTFKTENEKVLGAPVTVVSNDTVDVASANAAFCGVAISVRGGAAAVQMSGFVTLPYTGEAPSYGVTTLAADGNGGVCAAATGVTATVIAVDEETAKVSFIF